MSRNYYYIVAGLPDLFLDGQKKAISLTEAIDEIAELLTPQHATLLRLLRLNVDNANLVSLLTKRKKIFEAGGNFSAEELEEEIKFPQNLPPYMLRFIEAYKEEKLPYPDLTADDQLSWLMYDELTAHPRPFIRSWFTFDLTLRNLLAGLNCRLLGDEKGDAAAQCTVSTSILGNNEAAGQIRKSRSPDFSLSMEYPWVEKVLSFSRKDLVDYEKNIDLLRWDWLDEETVFSYFRIETIMAFCIKLDIVERWQKLRPEVGKERLAKLLADLESGYAVMEEKK